MKAKPQIILHDEKEYYYLEKTIRETTRALTDHMIGTFVRDQVPGALMMLFFVYSRLTYRLHFSGADKVVDYRLDTFITDEEGKNKINKTAIEQAYDSLEYEKIPIEDKQFNLEKNDNANTAYQPMHVLFDKNTLTVARWYRYLDEPKIENSYLRDVLEQFDAYKKKYAELVEQEDSWANFKKKLETDREQLKASGSESTFLNITIDKLLGTRSAYYFNIQNEGMPNISHDLGVGFIFDSIENGLFTRFILEHLELVETIFPFRNTTWYNRLIKPQGLEINKTIIDLDEIFKNSLRSDKSDLIIKALLRYIDGFTNLINKEPNERVVTEENQKKEVKNIYREIEYLYKTIKKEDTEPYVNIKKKFIDRKKDIIEARVSKAIGRLLSKDIAEIENNIEELYKNFSISEIEYFNDVFEQNLSPFLNDKKINYSVSYLNRIEKYLSTSTPHEYIKNLIKIYTPLGEYIEKFEQHEHLLTQLKGYRAHLCHSYKEYLYGLEILMDETLGKGICSEICKELSCEVLIVPDKTAFMAQFIWAYTAFSHDIGYTIEKFSLWSKELFKSVAKSGPGESEIPVDLNTSHILLLANANKYIDIPFDYFLDKIGFNKEGAENKKSDRKKEIKKSLWDSLIIRKSHPVFSTIMLLESQKAKGKFPWCSDGMNKFNIPDSKDFYLYNMDRLKIENIIQNDKITDDFIWHKLLPPITFAIISHHMSKWDGIHKANIKIKYKDFPLAYFLAFCDLIQETGRPSSSKIETEKAFGFTGIDTNEDNVCATINFGMGDLKKELKKEIRDICFLAKEKNGTSLNRTQLNKLPEEVDQFFDLMKNKLIFEYELFNPSSTTDSEKYFLVPKLSRTYQIYKLLLKRCCFNHINDFDDPGSKCLSLKASQKIKFKKIDDIDELMSQIKASIDILINKSKINNLVKFLTEIELFELDEDFVKLEDVDLNEHHEALSIKYFSTLKENIKNKFLYSVNIIGKIIKKIKDIHEFLTLYDLTDSKTLKRIEFKLKAGLSNDDSDTIHIKSDDPKQWFNHRLHPGCLYGILKKCDLEGLLNVTQLSNDHIDEIDYNEEILTSGKFGNHEKKAEMDKVLLFSDSFSGDIFHYGSIFGKKARFDVISKNNLDQLEEQFQLMCNPLSSELATHIFRRTLAGLKNDYDIILSEDYIQALTKSKFENLLYQQAKKLKHGQFALNAFVYGDTAGFWNHNKNLTIEDYKTILSKFIKEYDKKIQIGISVIKNINTYHPSHNGLVPIEHQCNKILIIIKKE